MWLLNSICAGLLDPFQYIMSDEAWFHLSGHVISQNTRYWAAENSHLMHEQPLQDKKVGVWCAVSGTRINGPIFLDRTVNTEVYMNIFEELCAELTEKERQSFFFQQDGPTCHTSRVSLQRVHHVFFEEWTVSKNLWLPHSPDLTTCNYFLWGTWKVRYTNQIRTWYRNWRTKSATQLQPSKSTFYIGYTWTWLDVHSCVLMQEATIFSIFYDGLSFQHLTTVLISVYPLCYRPWLLFRGPSCITETLSFVYWNLAGILRMFATWLFVFVS